MYNFADYVKRASLFVNNNFNSSNKKLSTFMIYATDLCDSGCKHCLIWAKNPVVHLPKDKILDLMNSKCVTKNTTVGLEGGEFLLHPEAFEIMKWFHKNHPKFDLLTNCLKPENAIEAVKKYPPKRLFLSLDGTKETYKYMRGKDGYESVLKVIEGAKDIVPISAMFTLSPYNSFDDMKHVAEVCKKYEIDLRVGVYNDIAFFDTVEKAHETDIAEKKNTELLKRVEILNAKKDGTFTKKNEELAVLEKQEIHIPKHKTRENFSSFKDSIPQEIKEFAENYDFLVLYDEWRKKKLKLNCYSILDSLIVLPNGDVPICQNLDLKLGNVYKMSLDEIFNGESTQAIHEDYKKNCNQCWINFHRKYDVVLYRSFEKFFPKNVVSKLFGYYQWEENSEATYSNYIARIENTYK